MITFILMVAACMVASITMMILTFIVASSSLFMKWYMSWVMKKSSKLVDTMFDTVDEGKEES